jgi:NTP pyrophosphatase (non-canonical NTP hydrolase)
MINKENNMSKSVQFLTDELKQFAITRDWEKFHTPKNLSMALIAEAAELVEHFQWLTPEQSMEISGEKLNDIGYELADIFIYLLRISERLNIDLVQVTEEKIAINEKRFPAGDTSEQNHKDKKYKKEGNYSA